MGVVFVTFIEPRSHSRDRNFKMMFSFSWIWNTPHPFMFWQGYLTLNVCHYFVFEIHVKFPLIWHIETYVWTDKRERERPLSDPKRNWRRAHDRLGEFIIIYYFDTIVGVREPNYGNICLSLLHADFFYKTMFLTNGMRYIYCWWIILLSWLDSCCLKTWGVWISGIKDICICGMRLTVDVAIDKFNWYVVILIWDDVVMMIMSTWIDVIIDEYVNMKWCGCCW